jgi:hypothetical protein
MWEWRKFVAVWVDDDGTCRDQHVLVEGPWHRYQSADGQTWALRCPLKLTRDEQARVVDDIPPGSWEEKVAVQKQERLQQEARKRLAEKEEAKRSRY